MLDTIFDGLKRFCILEDALSSGEISKKKMRFVLNTPLRDTDLQFCMRTFTATSHSIIYLYHLFDVNMATTVELPYLMAVSWKMHSSFGLGRQR